MSARRILLGTIVIATAVAQADDIPRVSLAMTPEAAGFVSIQALMPDVRLDIRYATRANFVGERIDGYEALRCYLLKPVAEALQRVEVALREEQFRLRIFDCYRPVRAVKHFVRWAGDPDDQRTKPLFYPALDKSELLGEYIASTSGHSRGATLDLTLMRCDSSGQCANLDMGTEFDFFDSLANTESPEITPRQRENRQRLRAAMEKEGFHNYAMEWWHYTFQPEPSKDVAYDFPVK